MIRCLIVDDSRTARALLRAILSSDPELEVVGEAEDGEEGVQKARALSPDVITMDVQMPKMDGLAATQEIMVEAPAPIVIVSQGFLAREVDAAMQAIRLGALSVVNKPRGPQDPDFAASAREIVETVKNMSRVKVVRRWRGLERTARKPQARPEGAVRGLAILASTGGPAALARLLPELPQDYPLPVLVVQHIAIGFVEGFASWLDSQSKVRVKVAEAGERLERGTVYIAPSHAHLCVGGGDRVHLDEGAPLGGFRPSGTKLFRSVAETWGREAVALVLTGMGRDGVDGLRDLRAAGGVVVGQDEASSVVYGMAQAAAQEGLVNEELGLEDIIQRCRALGGAAR
jgi:two-component system chemotaxis response regulator CheB